MSTAAYVEPFVMSNSFSLVPREFLEHKIVKSEDSMLKFWGKSKLFYLYASIVIYRDILPNDLPKISMYLPMMISPCWEYIATFPSIVKKMILKNNIKVYKILSFDKKQLILLKEGYSIDFCCFLSILNFL